MLVDTSVFCSQETAISGIITKIPKRNSPYLAGHAVVIVGYTTDGYFIIRNSWGVNWGLGYMDKTSGVFNYDQYNGSMRGYFKVPFAYINNSQIVSELYAVTTINNTQSTINSCNYTLDPFLDSSCKLEPTSHPLATEFSSLTIDQYKLKINISYYVDPVTKKYIWVFVSSKLVGSSYEKLCEIDITNFNHSDDGTIKIGFYNKNNFITSYINGSQIAITRATKLGYLISINTTNGRLSSKIVANI